MCEYSLSVELLSLNIAISMVPGKLLPLHFQKHLCVPLHGATKPLDSP